MPYTLAHPGFILPLKKLKPEWFSTSGLIFGSIAPDFDIILRFTNPRMHIFQYTINEILFFIFPIAVCSAIYFHLVIRPILIHYSPISLYSFLDQYKKMGFPFRSTTSWFRLFTSALFAIFFHLLMDLFSHYNAWYYKINAMYIYQSLIAGEIAYYLATYLPGIFLSALGFYLILKTFKENNIPIPSITEMKGNKNSMQFIYVYISVTIFFTFIKVFITGIENKFPIDSIIIHLTNGILISFFITPALFFVQRRLKTSNV